MLHVYHQSSNMLPPDLLKDRFAVGQNVQRRYSTRFAAMLQDKLYVFCTLFYRAFKNDLADSTDTQSEVYVHCYDCND